MGAGPEGNGDFSKGKGWSWSAGTGLVWAKLGMWKDVEQGGHIEVSAFYLKVI